MAIDILERHAKNLAIHTNPDHSLHQVESNIPEPGPNDCLVHVRATGICGSDVHFWKHGSIGDMVVCGENGLGHESAGVVIKTGCEVKNFRPGDRVALECGVPCSKPSCNFCRSGQYNACPDVIFFSTPPYHGTMRRFHVHPSQWLHHLPAELSFEEGSLLEPLSVALAGIDRSGLRLGDPLVICGAGPIGLVCLLAAHAAGAAPIVITDIDESRLECAKSLVPRVRTVCVGMADAPKATAGKVVEALGAKAKLVLECTGVESSIHTGIYVSSSPFSRIRHHLLMRASRPAASALRYSLSALAEHSKTFPSCTSLQMRSTFASSSATTTPIRKPSLLSWRV